MMIAVTPNATPAPTIRVFFSMTDLLALPASPVPSGERGEGAGSLRHLRGSGPHLVPNRLLRRRNHFHRPAFGRDLLGGLLREVVRLDSQLLRQLALTEDADAVGRALRQACAIQRFAVHDIAVVERRVEVADVDDEIVLAEASVAEAALGDAAE